jgi:hypothetical protein
MQVNFIEYEGCFSIEMTPETPKETIELVRLGINKTKEVRGVYVTAFKGSDKVIASVILGKQKRSSNEIGKR